MKRLSKIQFAMLSAFVTVSSFMASCSSDIQEVTGQQQSEKLPSVTYAVSISSTMDDDGSLTRALATEGSGEGESLVATWGNETVHVYAGDEKVGTLTPLTTGGASTTLNGTLTKEGGFAVNDELTLYYLKDKNAQGVYSGQLGTIADIAANYDYATATVTVTQAGPSTVFGNDNILKTSAASFTKSQAVVKLLPGFKNAALSVTSLTITSTNLAGSPLTVTPAAATNTLYFVLHNTASGAQDYTFDAVAGGQTYTYSASRTFADATFTHPTSLMNMKKKAENLTIDAIADQTYTNADIKPEPVVRDGSYTLVKGTDYNSTISYSNNRNVGQATVTITTMGDNYTGTKSQTFNIVKATPTITFTGDLETNNYGIIDLRTATNTLSIGASANLGATIASYTSSDTSVATVSSTGVVTGLSGGTTTITVRTTETANLNVQTRTLTVYVKEGIGGGLNAPGVGQNW